MCEQMNEERQVFDEPTYCPFCGNRCSLYHANGDMYCDKCKFDITIFWEERE